MAFREEDVGIKEHQKDGCLKDALDRQPEHLPQNKETSELQTRCTLCVCVSVKEGTAVTYITAVRDVAFVAIGT